MKSNHIVEPKKLNWEPTVVITTIIVLIITIALVFVIIFIPTNTSVLVRYILLVAAGGSFIGVFLYAPRYITVTNSELIIKRAIGDLVLSNKDIIDVTTISADSIKNSIRIFGSGGVCGYFGKFSNRTLGQYTMYITERKNLILVSTPKRKYVFNYNNAEELKTALSTTQKGAIK